VYDPKSEAREFIGVDRAEAVAAACRHFGLAESELTIAAPEAGEVSGLGARVVVVAAPPAGARPARPRREDEGDRDRGDRDRGRGRDRGDRDRDRGRGRDRGGRGGDRDRGDRGDRGGRGREREPMRDREPGREREPVREREPQEERAAAPSMTIDESSEATVEGELGPVGGFVRGIVERMKLGSFRIAESGEEGLVVIQLHGNAAMRLSTAQTRVGDAIQLLANQFSIKGGQEGPRVVVDVEGDRTRRDAYLEQLAQRAADRARDMGRAVALDPMNGKDRRAIHVALRGENDVATMSVGEGQYRQVVVVPEGAPEYEEARRKSREAAQAEGE